MGVFLGLYHKGGGCCLTLPMVFVAGRVEPHL